MAIPTFLEPLEDLTPPVNPAPLAASAAGAAGPGSHTLTGFAMQPQEQTEWCWAAVSTSVAVFFGSGSWTQCQVASGELHPIDCCGADASGGCNKPWYLD